MRYPPTPNAKIVTGTSTLFLFRPADEAAALEV